MQKIYRLSETGLKALTCRDSGLPAPYRQILGLVRTAACADDICQGMRNYPRETVLKWLDELDTLCFVEFEHIAVARAA